MTNTIEPTTPTPSNPNKDERTWAMGAHLSTFLGWSCIPFANIIAPLLIWQIKKDSMPFTADQAKEALNFQISLFLYAVISVILCLLVIGYLGLLAILALNIFCTVMAAIKSNEGIAYRYPCTIRFIK
ncbi:DUF4870 domain-containing protein [Rubritalea tangerina]|uniref:DUF4870 domain-containing protein n=1 Tax=Rubritalea tangerina TaxID=430798 RepID=A0ABW4Z915_9BACT